MVRGGERATVVVSTRATHLVVEGGQQTGTGVHQQARPNQVIMQHALVQGKLRMRQSDVTSGKPQGCEDGHGL